MLIKRLYLDLMIRYLLLVAGAVAGVFGAFVYMNRASSALLAGYAAGIIEYGNRAINFSRESEELILQGEKKPAFRYEVVQDYAVIYAEGPDIGGETVYSPEEISSMIERHYELIPDIIYIPEYYPFTGTDGESYALIIKKPKDSPEIRSKTGVLLPEYLRGTEVELSIYRLIWKTVIIVTAVLLIIAFLFSRLTLKKIIHPLRTLRGGLRKVDDSHLDGRLDFTANREFMEVRDAFNTMLTRLAEAETENRRLQESRRQFILDLSHDLKTPITTIQGYADALYSGMVEDDATRKKYLGYIGKKSRVVSDLITKLFDYSRLENTHTHMNIQEDDLAGCFRDVIIRNLDGLEESRFSVEIDIPEEPVPFVCDTTEISRALDNIITNQIKYNPDGTAVTYILKHEYNAIRLELRDNGIGIEKEVQDRIFNLMVRGDVSRHGVEGTGLGLAITKKIVELHGGNITLESGASEGSAFVIIFPVNYGEEGRG